MDDTILFTANIVGFLCLLALLNRVRYTVLVVGTIINKSCSWVNSENQFSIELEYLVNEERIKQKICLPERSANHYREGDRIALRLLPNNSYKFIIVHSPFKSTLKFFVFVAVVIDIYTYLEMLNIIHNS